MKIYGGGGEVEVQRLTFLTSVLVTASGQLHIPFVLPRQKYGYKAEWAARQTGTLWKKKKSFSLARNLTPFP
jgi:hypothetical protein